MRARLAGLGAGTGGSQGPRAQGSALQTSKEGQPLALWQCVPALPWGRGLGGRDCSPDGQLPPPSPHGGEQGALRRYLRHPGCFLQ